MALFDLDLASKPLPRIDVELPRIDTQSFLPNLEASDVFGPNFSMGSLFEGFPTAQGFGGNEGFYVGSPSMSGPFSSPYQSFRSMLPQYGATRPASSYTFPWDKPPEDFSGMFPGGGYPGGIGSATGGYAILNQYDQAFMQAAAAHGGGIFDANWLKAIAMMEGGWGAGSTSGAGAQGIMQIMPGGYPDGERLYPNWRTDPMQNIMLGAYILSRKIAENGGSRDMGTQRYLGVGTDPWTGISTEEYLRRIQGFYNDLNTRTAPSGGGPYTGTPGNAYLSIFGGQSYPISSQHGVSNSMPASWYANIDDELGLPIGAHAGVDVAMPRGTRLYMPVGFTGRVTRASGANGYAFYNNTGPGVGELRIEGTDAQGRRFMLIFGHMMNIYLPVGSLVTGRTLLGLSGGAGSGDHLHLEYRIPGNTSTGWMAVDPRQYLR